MIIRVPGRANLIGEHVDYAGGRVLPVAIDRFVTLTANEQEGDVITLVSRHAPGVVEIRNNTLAPGSPSWGRYAEAVATELTLLGRPPVGIEGAIESDLPSGAGLSSSAALEVAIGSALCDVGGFEIEPLALAQACRRAEHRAVGVPCGLMDQAAVTLGRRGHVLHLDCGTETWEHIEFPEDVAILLVHSGIERSLATSEYGRRREEFARGDARRVRHVRTEIERVDAVTAELRSPTPSRKTIGALFAESHRSLAEDYEVSTPELDLLVSLARAEGAFAARLTGAGFGGSIVALTEAGDADAIGAAIAERYRRATHRQSFAIACAPTDGASFRDHQGAALDTR